MKKKNKKPMSYEQFEQQQVEKREQNKKATSKLKFWFKVMNSMNSAEDK